MFGSLISVAATVAAVARTFPVRVCRFFIFIFGGRLRLCDVLSSFILFNKLKRTKEKT
jgi:hypothetical protein